MTGMLKKTQHFLNFRLDLTPNVSIAKVNRWRIALSGNSVDHNALNRQSHLLQGAASETLKNRVLQIGLERLTGVHHRVRNSTE